MAETLHEMAVRMVKGEDCQPQCGKGCDKCPASKLRSANGVCLVRRIAKVDNCEEQIEGLKAWAAEHPVPMYPSWQKAWQSLFPYAEELCPEKLFGEDCPEGMECHECLERPMSKKVAEKLGIKPINEGCDTCKYTDKAGDEEPLREVQRHVARGQREMGKYSV